MIEAHKLQPWDTMSLIKADLGSVCARARSSGSSQTPQENHPVSPLHEPLNWRATRGLKAKILSLQSLLRNGVLLAYVARNYNLKDLKVLFFPSRGPLTLAPRERIQNTFLKQGAAVCWLCAVPTLVSRLSIAATNAPLSPPLPPISPNASPATRHQLLHLYLRR